jgi:hypothetical protein
VIAKVPKTFNMWWLGFPKLSTQSCNNY